MARNLMTPQLKDELERKITELEAETKYMDSFLRELNQGGASSTEDANGIHASQRGTSTPAYFGASNTFIANPSNVGIGILARMIETDPTIMSAVQFKSLMMLSKVGEYQNENDEIEDFVRSFLNKMEGPTFKESCEGQSSNYGYGFSISEIIWGINNKNQKIPVRVPTYHPSTIAFEVDPYGNVTEEGVIQFVLQNSQFSNPNFYFPSFQNGFTVKNPFTTPEDRLLPFRMPFINNYGLTRIPKKKVVHHVYNSMLSFGSPYGKTPVRTAHLAWQLKVFFLKQMGIAGKRQASPFIHATAPHNMNKVEITLPNGQKKQVSPIEAMTEILNNRESDDSVVTGPEEAGYKITAIANDMDLNQFLAVINFLDTQMFRAFLLPSLVMTDGSAGSRALGDKHFQIVDRIAEEEALRFTQTIINSMIKLAIVYNFGEQENYGHFAQRPQNIEERERMSNMFANLANAGFMKAYDQKDGDYVRSTLHLPAQDKSFYTETMPNFDPVEGGENSSSDEIHGIATQDSHHADGTAKTQDEAQLETKSDAAFNGAQVTAVVNVVTSVSTGEIPLQTGKEILKSMFGFSDEQAERLLPNDIIKEVNKKEKEAKDNDENLSRSELKMGKYKDHFYEIKIAKRSPVISYYATTEGGQHTAAYDNTREAEQEIKKIIDRFDQ